MILHWLVEVHHPLDWSVEAREKHVCDYEYLRHGVGFLEVLSGYLELLIAGHLILEE